MREKNFNLYNFNITNINIINFNISNFNISNFNIFDYNYNNNFYVLENCISFIIYIKILLLFDINPIKLYTKYLPKDDKKYKNENFVKYFFRI